jgi:hypothetical protein
MQIAKRTINGLFDGITTEELDNLSAEVSAYMTSVHPDYAQTCWKNRRSESSSLNI